jgi:hypothetical protein
MNEDHEHDENCCVVYVQQVPAAEPIDLWNIAGVLLSVLAGLFKVVGAGGDQLAGNFWRHANYRAYQHAEAEQQVAAQQEIANLANYLEGVDKIVYVDPESS